MIIFPSYFLVSIARRAHSKICRPRHCEHATLKQPYSSLPPRHSPHKRLSPMPKPPRIGNPFYFHMFRFSLVTVAQHALRLLLLLLFFSVCSLFNALYPYSLLPQASGRSQGFQCRRKALCRAEYQCRGCEFLWHGHEKHVWVLGLGWWSLLALVGNWVFH
jgi:hypothetical protein